MCSVTTQSNHILEIYTSIIYITINKNQLATPLKKLFVFKKVLLCIYNEIELIEMSLS